MDYSKDKAMYSKNSAGGSPNEGEGVMNYDSSSSRSSTTGIGDSAGVGSGLSQVDGISVKDALMVTENQRPEAYREKIGDGFEIGC